MAMDMLGMCGISSAFPHNANLAVTILAPLRPLFCEGKSVIQRKTVPRTIRENVAGNF